MNKEMSPTARVAQEFVGCASVLGWRQALARSFSVILWGFNKILFFFYTVVVFDYTCRHGPWLFLFLLSGFLESKDTDISCHI